MSDAGIVGPAMGNRGSAYILDSFRLDASRFTVNAFRNPDPPELPHHNHRWEWCWSIILAGGYTHEFFHVTDGVAGPVSLRTFREGDVNFMPRSLYHKIVALEPNTYTFLCSGPTIPGHGFEYWVPGRGSVPWNEL
jgi:hypothetical protein